MTRKRYDMKKILCILYKKKVRSCHHWSRPAGGWGRELWASARQTPGVGPDTRRRPSNYGVGTRSPTCTLVEYSTVSGLVHPQLKPVSQFTILLGPG